MFDCCEDLDRDRAQQLFASPRRAHAGPLQFEWNDADYDQRFRRLHEFIAAGDLYQANLTFRAGFSFVGDARTLYRALRRHSAAGHCAFIDDGERQILSLSPELFFEMTPDGIIRAMPMKGTAARGESPGRRDRARAGACKQRKAIAPRI